MSPPLPPANPGSHGTRRPPAMAGLSPCTASEGLRRAQPRTMGRCTREGFALEPRASGRAEPSPRLSSQGTGPADPRGSDRPRLDTSTRASSVLRGFRSLCTRGTGSRGISWRLRSHCALCVDRALPHATSATSSLGTWVPQSAPGLRAGSMTAGAQPGPLSPGDLQAEGRRVCISWRELSRTTYWSPGRGGSSVRSRLRHSVAWIPPGLWRTWFPRAGSAPSVSVLSGDRPRWPRWWPLCLGAPVPASPPWA